MEPFPVQVAFAVEPAQTGIVVEEVIKMITHDTSVKARLRNNPDSLNEFGSSNIRQTYSFNALKKKVR